MSCGNIITIWALLIGSSQAGNCYYGMEEALLGMKLRIKLMFFVKHVLRIDTPTF